MPLTTRTVLLAKVESTYGSDPTHAATDARLVHDFDISYESERYARSVMSPTFTPTRASVIGRKSVRLTFWEYMRGNASEYDGTEVPSYDPFLRACGFSSTYAGGGANTQTYAPIATGFESVAIEVEIDGVVAVVLGCRGNVRMVFTPGEPARFEYEFFGLYTAPADRALSTPDYDDDVAPSIVAATGFQPWSENPADGSVFGHCGSLVLDMRNRIVPRQSLTVGAQGIAAWEIVGRGTVDDPGSAVALEFEAKANPDGDDFWTRWTSRTVSGSSTVNVGSGVATNEHTLTLNDLVIDDIQFGDNDGRVMNILDCRVLGEAPGGIPTGNDDISLVAT